MRIIRKYKWSVILALVVIACVAVVGALLSFRYRDDKLLADFEASYKTFDKAIADFSRSVFTSNPEGAPAIDDLGRNAREALVELHTKASALSKISSATKNDPEIRSQALKIADVSGKELDALSAYKKALRDERDADADRLAKEFDSLTNSRTAAYAYFQGLGE